MSTKRDTGRTFLVTKQGTIIRIDKNLFTGPFMIKKISQLTMAYRYKQGGIGFDYFHKYFNDIWNDNKISKRII